MISALLFVGIASLISAAILLDLASDAPDVDDHEQEVAPVRQPDGRLA